MKEIKEVIYPVSVWVVKFDFCKDCYANSLNELLSNRMLMQLDADTTIKQRKKPGKEILN